MKVFKIIAFFFFSITLSNCKESKDTDSEKLASTNRVINDFTIKLNVIATKDDSFQVYYRTTGVSTYTEDKSIYTEFKGSDKPQDIVFTLPSGIIPDFIRLDFGVNKNQDFIKVNSFKMSYFGKEFSAVGSDFFNYFLVEEKTMSFDKVTATLSPLTIKDNHDPITTSEQRLYNEIQKLVK